MKLNKLELEEIFKVVRQAEKHIKKRNDRRDRLVGILIKLQREYSKQGH